MAVVEEGLDLAIRISVLTDSALIARKLSDMPLVLCASPGYLNEHGIPQNPLALGTHSCLIYSNQQEQNLWRFHTSDGEQLVRVNASIRVNSPGALAEMALGGLGITRAPLYMVENALETGALVEVLPDFPMDVFGVYALYPPNRHLTRRVRALIDHLASAFGPRWTRTPRPACAGRTWL